MLILDELQLSFLLMVQAFCIVRNLCLSQGHKDFLLGFLLEVL